MITVTRIQLSKAEEVLEETSAKDFMKNYEQAQALEKSLSPKNPESVAVVTVLGGSKQKLKKCRSS